MGERLREKGGRRAVKQRETETESENILEGYQEGNRQADTVGERLRGKGGGGGGGSQTQRERQRVREVRVF